MAPLNVHASNCIRIKILLKRIYSWGGLRSKQVIITTFFHRPRHRSKHSYPSCKCIFGSFNTTEKAEKLPACIQILNLNCVYKKTILKEWNLPRNASCLWSSTSLSFGQDSYGGLDLNAIWRGGAADRSFLFYFFLLLGGSTSHRIG